MNVVVGSKGDNFSGASAQQTFEATGLALWLAKTAELFGILKKVKKKHGLAITKFVVITVICIPNRLPYSGDLITGHPKSGNI